MHNLLPFSSFFDETDPPIRPTVEVFEQCLTTLTLRRPTDDYNNFVDSHNYALVWAMSDAHFARKNRLYVLVTSSPTPYYIFRQMPWGQYPDAAGTDLSLVRHPVQGLYLARALAAGADVQPDLRLLVTRLRSLLRQWTSIPAYSRFALGNESPATVVRLPQSQKYLATLVAFRASFNSLFTPARQAIESDMIVEENTRLTHDVSRWASGTRVTGSVEHFVESVSTRIAFNLFDEMTHSALRYAKHLLRESTNLPRDLLIEVDDEGILSTRPRLIATKRHREEFSCIEWRVSMRDSKKLFLGADLFGDFYSVWWTARATFPEFLSSLRRMLAILPTGMTERKREHSGVDFFVVDEPVPVNRPLTDFPELQADDILAAIRPHDLEMIRLATKAGDYYYEFRARGAEPPKCGLVSHIAATDHIAWLIWTTNQQRASIAEVKRTMTMCFGDLKHAGKATVGTPTQK